VFQSVAAAIQNKGMDANRLRELLHREPFEPFRLVLSSGTSYDIRNPELVVPMNREAFLAFEDGDRCAFVPYMHVASIETGGNGNRPNN